MNDLEERLRAALDARAQTFETSPDAWLRVRERRPRRYRALRLAAAALPVALLAVFVPVLIGGGLGRNTAADADAIYQGLMRGRTAAGEQVTVDNPTEGKPLRLWFAKGRLGNPELCYVVERVDAEGYGGCSRMPTIGSDAWFAGSTVRDQAESALDWGVAVDDIGTVTGVAGDGQRFPGQLWRPAGAPYRIWTVTYPARQPLSKIEISDDRGRDLGERSRDMFAAPQPGQALGAAHDLPAGVTARPFRTKEGTELRLTRGGAELGTVLLGQAMQPVDARMRENVITGVAAGNVSRIAFSFEDGTTAQVGTRPDPWGLGITLFAAEGAPDDGQERHRLVAYDASGAEVWRDEAKDPQEGMPPVGEVMSLPGTGAAGEPVRVWFTDAGPDTGRPRVTLCYSGGVDPDLSCIGGGRDPDHLGSPLRAVQYLPEPGTVSYFGAAGDDWESVEAVLSDGRRLPATFRRGTGTPAPIWYVTIPSSDAEVAGFTMKRKDRPLGLFPETRKDCGQQAMRSDTPRHPLPAGVTALVSEPNCLAFWENDELVMGLAGPLPGTRLSDLLSAEQPVRWGRGTHAWYGYALAGTARIEVTSSNGVTGTAQAAPDPWEQGVALFAAPIPEGADFSAGMVVKGFDAGGKQLWQQD
ncbi:hypothetical protein [Nonomuraea sp. GTA35]|uniref:hypothetical protein n=1 Tax=Nonomuraea sp. GTA35 TaxID=1676746 RepID=UPI0035BEFC26